uniref:Uncharacterized protein n=1 Tax=Romanomermis culicivorax TaxID=13658 RepID=A0A915KTE8_ROMCU
MRRISTKLLTRHIKGASGNAAIFSYTAFKLFKHGTSEGLKRQSNSPTGLASSESSVTSKKNKHATFSDVSQ